METKQLREIRRWGRGWFPFSLHLLALFFALGCSKLPEPPRHLLLVTIDTIRADRVGCYGRKNAGTPNLDRLAEEGVRFERAYASVPLTLPSHISILTGLHPPHSGIHDNGERELKAGVKPLAVRLAEVGFFTAGAVGGYPVSGIFPTTVGFTAFDDRFADPRNPAGLERSAEMVVDAALRLVDSRAGKRLFLWVHFYDPHDPYEPPDTFKRAFPGDPYQGEIAAVDAALGRLLSGLKQRLGNESLLVAVVGDHGEALGEHGELTHGYFVYEPTLRVPMLIKGPGIRPRQVLPGPFQTVDLVPTLLERIGLPIPRGLDGHRWALDGKVDEQPVQVYAESELAARHFGWAPLHVASDGRYKLIEAPRSEFYDLKTDPQETANRLADFSDEARNLLQMLAKIRGETAATPKSAPLDPNLASLGYVSSGGTVAPGESLDPKDNLSTYRRFQDAALALERGDGPAALVLIDQLQKQRPQPGLILQRGQALVMCNRLREASLEFERLAAADPAFPGLALERGKLRVWAGDGPGALPFLDRHLREAPRDAQALTFRGAARELSGDWTGAEADYRAAAQANPGFPDPQLRLAALLTRSERFSEAIQALREYLGRFPGDPRAAGLLEALERDRRH